MIKYKVYLYDTDYGSITINAEAIDALAAASAATSVFHNAVIIKVCRIVYEEIEEDWR